MRQKPNEKREESRRMIRWMAVALMPFLFSIFLGAAEPGTLYSNTAQLSYQADNTEQNLSSNEVNLTVASTPAQIEFLRYDPSGSNEQLPATQYLDAADTPQPSPPATLPDGRVIPAPSSVGMSPASDYLTRDLVIVRVRDLDRDTNASSVQSLEVNVTNAQSGEIETLILHETGENTGVFVGYLLTDPTASTGRDGQIRAASGEHLIAEYLDDTGSVTLEARALVHAPGGALLVGKSQSKDHAAAGDYLRYTVTVENISDIALRPVTVEDRLPPGIKYQSGSLRVDGQPAKAELSRDGRTLRYDFNNSAFAPGERHELRYVALVTAGTLNGEATNRAWATAPGVPRSNVASVTLRIDDELGRTRGYILGQVYDADAGSRDANGSGHIGVEGVRLYMEDGRYVVTDEEGKYHFVDVKNGTHVVQIDTDSIKGRYELARCEESVRFAGKSFSQFVEIDHGGMKRVDFCLRRLPGAGGEASLEMSLARLDSKHLRLHLVLRTDMPLIDPQVFVALPEGIHYLKGSADAGSDAYMKDGALVVPMDRKSRSLTLELEPHGDREGSIRGILFYDTRLEKDQHSDVAELLFRRESDRPYISKVLTAHRLVRSESVGSRTPVEAGDFDWTQPTHRRSMPDYTPSKVDTLGKKPAIVWPPKGWIPWIPSTRIAVLKPAGTSLDLRLNGKKVDPLNYEDLFRSSDKSMEVVYYKGVDLQEGSNRITAVIKGKGGKVLARLTREVYVESRRPKRLEYLPEYSWPVADGKHPPILAVRFIGPSGHPLRSGLVGSYTTEGRYEPGTLNNGKGQYTIDSEGIAYIRLKPTVRSGEARLHFVMADGEERILRVRIKPKMRDWIVVGFAEGTVGYRTLHSHAETLREAGVREHFYKKGRVSFFAKGAIKGKWLMTLAYDTGRRKGDRTLFDTLDPDAYYTLYQDATTQGNEAPSTRKLYLKLERDEYSVLFGDFHTDMGETELTRYDNAFTGVQARYDGNRLRAKLFAARSEDLHFRDDLRGNGTRGYYHLSHTPVVEGSETVTLEVRDRHHPERVLSRRTLGRDSDYEIDYDRGTLYFHDPIYSRDHDFNPQYIVVQYEVKGRGGRHYTWGGRVSYGEGERWRVGASYVDEDHGDGHARLMGVDASVKVGEHLKLRGEIAQSRNRDSQNRTLGNARLFEAEYNDLNLTGRAWYRYQDRSFGLGQLDEALGGTRQIGVEGSRKLTRYWSLEGTLFQNRDYDDGNISDENVFESRVRYDDSNFSAALGYRLAKNSHTPATHQITAEISRYFLERRLKLTLGHEQSLGSNRDSEYPTRSYLTADFKYDENSSLLASIERDQGADGVSWSSRVGYEYTPWKDGRISLGRVMESGHDGSRIYDTFGLDQTLRFGEEWSLRLGYEKGLSEAGSDDSFDAFNVDLDYRGERYTGRIALGYRVGGGEKQFDLDTALAMEKNSAMGLGTGLEWHDSWGGGDRDRDVDAKLAFVYLPERTDWIVLDRFDFKDEWTADANGSTRSNKFINHLHLDWKPEGKPWELGLQYALKYNIDTIDGTRYSGWTDLAGLDVSYDINEHLAVGFQGSILHSYAGNNLDYGAGVFVTTSLLTNTQLTLGYNFAGFDDEDFSEQNYRYQGVYLRVRMKFDQQDLKRLIDGVLR
jgi:uncharacterized repeat protein (TIGR01451 family)